MIGKKAATSLGDMAEEEYTIKAYILKGAIQSRIIEKDKIHFGKLCANTYSALPYKQQRPHLQNADVGVVSPILRAGIIAPGVMACGGYPAKRWAKPR